MHQQQMQLRCRSHVPAYVRKGVHMTGHGCMDVAAPPPDLHVEALRHTHKRIIHRLVTMGVVLAQHLTNHLQQNPTNSFKPHSSQGAPGKLTNDSSSVAEVNG